MQMCNSIKSILLKKFRYNFFNSFIFYRLQYWNTLALDGSNWQYVDLFDFQTDIKGSVVENLSRRCGSFLKNMSLENCKWISDDAIK